jgi:alpha-galactosidase
VRIKNKNKISFHTGFFFVMFCFNVSAHITTNARSFYVTTNTSLSTLLSCDPTKDGNTYNTVQTSIRLKAGDNTIKFDNTKGFAPNLDKIYLELADSKVIPFGTNNKIEYNLTSGTYSVFFDGKKVISDAYAQCNSDKIYKSNDVGYTSRVYSSNVVDNAYGSGQKHIITLTGNGMIQMEQVFYTYASKSNLFTEVFLKGAGSNCYYSSPLSTNNIDIQTSGDTRALKVPFDNDKWVRYDAVPLANADFTCSDVTALYDNNSRNGLVVGSLEQTDWKTGVLVKGNNASTLSKFAVYGGYTDSHYTSDKMNHGWVGVGETSCKSPLVSVGYHKDWREGMDDYGKYVALSSPKYIFDWVGATPFIWNSWGAIQKEINLTNSKAVTDFFANSCKGFRNDKTLFIDLDSYWDNMDDGDLKLFADYVKSKGMVPGIYWAPFVDWSKTDRKIENSTYSYSNAWIKQNGKPVEIAGAWAMDPTHRGTKDRIDYILNRFKKAGFGMIKLDFLTHGAAESEVFFNKKVTTGMQAYNEGMKYIVDKLAGSMLIYASICPNLATAKYSHVRRIACDTYQSIDETQYSLNSTNYGWWQSNIYDYVDADHVVYDQQSIGANRARLASSLITGTITVGDNFSKTDTWTSRAQSLLQNQDLLNISRNGKAFQPVEGNTGTSCTDQYALKIGNYYYLTIFNFGNNNKTFNINLNRVGLSGTNAYTNVKELFSGAYSNFSGTVNTTIGPTDCKIFRFTLSSPNGIVNNGIYEIKSVIATDKNIEVKSSGTANGANVQIGIDSNADNQRWKVTDLNNGFYKLSPVHANTKVLEVQGSSNVNGVNVQIAGDASITGQKWKIISIENNKYKLLPECAPTKCLNLFGSSDLNGTNVDILDDNGAEAQKWIFEFTKSVLSTTDWNTEESILQVYPNPTKTDFTISYNNLIDGDNKVYFSLVNLLGVTVYKQEAQIKSGENKILVKPNNISNGLYILNVLDSSNKIIHFQKVIYR